ncbi:hypothetical protein AYO44_06995 [Planctomycetaceae bacterium SCGC AG-212-F19]|nr:hypothetical protein AYO44_06995 [Planctomycetaceae bacterium SCGC AG-212-F19]
MQDLINGLNNLLPGSDRLGQLPAPLLGHSVNDPTSTVHHFSSAAQKTIGFESVQDGVNASLAKFQSLLR